MDIKEKMKRLNATMASINKRYGKDTVMKASDAAIQGKLTKKVIPTPSFELNEALHCRGFAGIVELYGPNSSGKTSLAIDTIVKNQREDPNFVAAWMETEGSITEEILKDHGVDLERLIFWKQEDVGNAENALDVARGFIASGDIDMLVVNSVAGLSPKTEIEDDLEKQNIALIARLLSKFFRVATGLISKNDITTIFINQTRDNVGVMFGNPETTSGGKAIGFYASQRIRMGQNKLMASDPIKEGEGVKISCAIKKNRFAGTHNPLKKCIYYARYDRGIDSVVSLPQFLLDANIMRQSGAWWYYEDSNGNLMTDRDGQPYKWRSKNDFISALYSNLPLRKELMDKLYGTGVGTESFTKEEIEETEKEEAEINAEMEKIDRMEDKENIDEVLKQNG